MSTPAFLLRMSSLPRAGGVAPGGWLALLLLSFALGGCRSIPTEVPLTPPLQLIEAPLLALAADCRVQGSVFIGYRVRTDGRTEDLMLPPGPACLQDALRAWIGGMLYSPPAAATSTGMEWMLVLAQRGS